MKTITLSIPDDGKIRIMKGRNLYAFIEDGFLYYKIKECSHCGECCLADAPFPDSEGRCIHLVKLGDIFECVNHLVPWSCINEDHHNMPDCCSIRYRKERIE
jgi:hypothetical protein